MEIKRDTTADKYNSSAIRFVWNLLVSAGSTVSDDASVAMALTKFVSGKGGGFGDGGIQLDSSNKGWLGMSERDGQEIATSLTRSLVIISNSPITIQIYPDIPPAPAYLGVRFVTKDGPQMISFDMRALLSKSERKHRMEEFVKIFAGMIPSRGISLGLYESQDDLMLTQGSKTIAGKLFQLVLVGVLGKILPVIEQAIREKVSDDTLAAVVVSKEFSREASIASNKIASNKIDSNNIKEAMGAAITTVSQGWGSNFFTKRVIKSHDTKVQVLRQILGTDKLADHLNSTEDLGKFITELARPRQSSISQAEPGETKSYKKFVQTLNDVGLEMVLKKLNIPLNKMDDVLEPQDPIFVQTRQRQFREESLKKWAVSQVNMLPIRNTPLDGPFRP